MTTGRETAVYLQGIFKRFGDAFVVKGVDLAIPEGEFFSLIGPSGCGKTTLLRMIAGLEQPTSGAVEVHGRDLTTVPAHRRPVNTVFQNYALFPHLNVKENVAFGLRERRVRRKDIESRVKEMLELVQLSGRSNARPSELSGGQQQRVALARALVLSPEVLLLDEPLGALDLKLRREMQTLLRRIQRDVGITFIYVTHDQEEAFSMSSRIGVMRDGLLHQVGTPREVYRRPANGFVARFSGGSNLLSVRVMERGRPGRYQVSVNGSVERMFGCGGPPNLEVGSTAMIVLRPELLTMLRGDTRDALVTGTVADISYGGSHTVYIVDTNGIGTVNVECTELSGEAGVPALGDCVGIRWSDNAAWLVSSDDDLVDVVEPAPLGQPLPS